MSWPRNLILVRHGESEGNLLSIEERARLDVPTYEYALTERGRQQAAITGEWLREQFPSFDTYYTSYYKRSIETMQIISPGVRAHEDARVAEAQRGIWHTMTPDQVRAKYPEEFVRRDREGLYHYRPFGGENWADVELRIHSFLGTLSRDYSGKDVLVVGHGHWMILFDRLVQRFGIAEAVERYSSRAYHNAAVTHYVEGIKSGCPRMNLIKHNFVPWVEWKPLDVTIH